MKMLSKRQILLLHSLNGSKHTLNNNTQSATRMGSVGRST